MLSSLHESEPLSRSPLWANADEQARARTNSASAMWFRIFFIIFGFPVNNFWIFDGVSPGARVSRSAASRCPLFQLEKQAVMPASLGFPYSQLCKHRVSGLCGRKIFGGLKFFSVSSFS